MEYKTKEWESIMASFQKSVEVDLKEIRKWKAEMQKMRRDMMEQMKSGRYIRDNERLIISAPEIIIGNVDPSGVLYERENSKIILRGTQVGVQAAGETGQVEIRAASIREVAEDPGVDGYEHVVGNLSEIVNQARSVVINSRQEPGAFPRPPIPQNVIGILVQSDSSLSLSALKGNENREDQLNLMIEGLEKQKKQLGKLVELHKESFKNLLKEIDSLMDEKNKLMKDENAVRIEYQKLDWLNKQLDAATRSMASTTNDYGEVLSEFVETNRLLNTFKSQLSSGKMSEDDFKKKSTNTSISIASELIHVVSEDGDFNLRDNPGAGIDMTANQFTFNATEADRSLKENGKLSIMAKNIEMVSGLDDAEYDDKGNIISGTHKADGKVRIQSKNILLESVDYEIADKQYKEKRLNPEGQIKLRSKNIVVSTENAANIEKDENGKITKANYTAEGDIIVNTKKLAVVSADYDIENGEVKEKSLTKDSQLFIRTEKTEFSATETNGEAKGSVSINAKDIAVKSMNVKEDDRSDDTIAYEGTMSLVTNKINLCTSESIQLQSPKIGLFADETVEAQQGSGESALQLSDGDVLLGGSKNEVVGNTEINGELKVPKATIDNMEVKTSLKSPNISDGMAASGPSSGKLNTKLKKDEFEDIKEALNKLRTEGVSEDYLDQFCEE